MKTSDIQAIKSTLNQTKEIDVYQLYSKSDIDQLVSGIETILQDKTELKCMEENKFYTKNMYDLVLFVYNKALTETKIKSNTAPKPQKHKLLSKNSLNNLYSFAS